MESRKPLNFQELDVLSDDDVETVRTLNEEESTDNSIVFDVTFYKKETEQK